MKTRIIPVIHYESDEQAKRNAAIAFGAGCDGVFLIHMEGKNHLLPSVAREIKAQHPNKLVGINYLGVETAEAVNANINLGLDMTWTDDQLTHSLDRPWTEAKRVCDVKTQDYSHLIFVGVAFKHQRHEPDPVLAARKALEFGFIPTTSGSATGVAADQNDVVKLRAGMGPGHPLAIASGITPENAEDYLPSLSHVLVATGVSSSFYELDAERLKILMAARRKSR